MWPRQMEALPKNMIKPDNSRKSEYFQREKGHLYFPKKSLTTQCTYKEMHDKTQMSITQGVPCHPHDIVNSGVPNARSIADYLNIT